MRLKEVANNGANRKLFRQVARDTTGGVYEPPPGEKIILCYTKDILGCEKLVGAASYRLADKLKEVPSADFVCQYFHMVSYLFVTGYNQANGCGSAMLRKATAAMMQHIRRPVRVESAQGAVGFFSKMGFTKTDPAPIVCLCTGSPLFRRLYRMELAPSSPGAFTKRRETETKRRPLRYNTPLNYYPG